MEWVTIAKTKNEKRNSYLVNRILLNYTLNATCSMIYYILTVKSIESFKKRGKIGLSTKKKGCA
ncbi:MAG TPA: hypothetical protein DEG96_07900 [Candidatus Atribacteria bacterium]|nr:hypothetical protein [Candidatus Atribacteria bacterium]